MRASGRDVPSRLLLPLVLPAALRVSRGRVDRFLKQIDCCVPVGLDVHIVMDNYATHKTAAVNRLRQWRRRARADSRSGEV